MSEHDRTARKGTSLSGACCCIAESYVEQRAALIAKHRDVTQRMRLTTDQAELRRLWNYQRDLHDAIHGYEQDVVRA